MGCGDARDVLAAKSPIRTQLSVSFPRRIPAIKAPARLETKGRWESFVWVFHHHFVTQWKNASEMGRERGHGNWKVDKTAAEETQEMKAKKEQDGWSRSSKFLAPISSSWHIHYLLWGHSKCWVVETTKLPLLQTEAGKKPFSPLLSEQIVTSWHKDHPYPLLFSWLQVDCAFIILSTQQHTISP